MTLPPKVALFVLSLALVSLTIGLVPVAPVAARPTEPVLTTVSFDFQTEIKTTFYSDGSVYEEGFDANRMRRLATKPGR